MLVLALQFSRCDVRTTHAERPADAGLDAAASVRCNPHVVWAGSLKTEEKTAAVALARGRDRIPVDLELAHDSPPVHQLEVSRAGRPFGHRRRRDTP
jgi:hypothetical protein